MNLAVSTVWKILKQLSFIVLLILCSNAFADTPADMEQQLSHVEELFYADPAQALALAETLNVEYPRQHEPKVWLARLYAQFSEFERSFSYAKQAAEYPLTPFELAHVERAVGYFYSYKQEKESAFRHFTLAVEAAKASEDIELWVETLSIKADILVTFGEVEQAMQEMALAYEKIDLVSTPEILASVYNTMCSIYTETGHTEGAIEAMLKSVSYVEQTQNAQQLSVVYFNLANLFAQNNQQDKALEAYQNSEKYSLEGQDDIGVGYAKMGIGNSYLNMQQPENAIEPLVVAESIFYVQQHVRNLVRIYADLAESYRLLGLHDNTREYLKKLDGYSKHNNPENRRVFIRAKRTMARLYYSLQEYDSAFQQQSMYIEALRELHKSELEQADKMVVERLSNTIMSKENQVLKLANQLKETELDKQKRQSNFLLTIAIFSIFITVFVTALLRKNNKLSEQLDKLATTDELTQLYNRRKIMSLLSERFSVFKRQQAPLYLALFDLDYFKKINDIYGHVVGDSVLKAIADCAIEELGERQKIGRYGGEEFLVILDVESYKEAHSKLEQFRKAVAKLDIQDLEMKVTISIGLSEAVEQDQFQTDVIHRADKALYAAKKAGRNQLLGQ